MSGRAGVDFQPRAMRMRSRVLISLSSARQTCSCVSRFFRRAVERRVCEFRDEEGNGMWRLVDASLMATCVELCCGEL